MECQEARENMLARRRGRLPPELSQAFDAHVATCSDCRWAAKADDALTDTLQRLPRRRASPELKDKLVQRLAASQGPARRVLTIPKFLVPAMTAFATAALVLVGLRVAPSPAFSTASARAASSSMIDEAINDHLRVVYADKPVEIESGGIHQVKPWFTGRLDFAPKVDFAGDDDFPLIGGRVGYFLDRKAAVLVFKRHLHVISLIIFPAGGLPWPADVQPLGRLKASIRSVRGFQTVTWADGDLGYALVSDLNPAELQQLALKVAGPGT